ncbi:enoyl-CoA hydratase/isomerase family protein [Aeromicrobium wangtongii]|uniref:Enoyl-CoA hydratase/isomerase family protein n=1 Tax=Aeromicrobium wangtongii TaxID=2969247 RepID=A0ABY5MBW6_9ACTN|nr:enoyl-CoA hydratase/isomerase family protein [Aeromicrobium wangtongii]MCD9196965.1 enoyl-CoA hydratase/isomerase family protein [Aeromicrobium wangtongii]UUP14470.1 enoyl-CoA hydratase/isomerase family protein [Aeromicrobium wangtongii]
MTGDDVLLVEKRPGGVAVVTLNRPTKLNAIDDALHNRLSAVWGELTLDLSVRAVVLTGSGRAFCAGGDSSTFPFGEDPEKVRRVRMSSVRDIVDHMVGFPLPVIAAVNGAAVGLGATLISLCDLTVMSEEAFLSDPHVSVGMVAGDGNAVTWPFLMSLARVKEFLFTGDRIPAPLALELGLVNRVEPAAETLDAAIALAQRLADQPTQAVQQTKRLVNMHLRQAAGLMMDMAVALETESFSNLSAPR